MKAKKTVIVILAGVLVLAAGLGTLSVMNYMRGRKEFIADGYILEASKNAASAEETEEEVTAINDQHYFSQGSPYREKFGTKVLFKDTSDKEIAVDLEEFVHYMDGSLGSFTKGVIMNIDDLAQEQFSYYSLTKNTVLVKNGSRYEVSSRGEAMDMEEFVWKISDTDYMLVSPEVTLRIAGTSNVTLPEYAQIKYVDSGIVCILHQQGAYQSVSADTVLITAHGAELNLVSKNFMVDGEPVLSLDAMEIGDSSYIELDENKDEPGLKIPTFNVINGKDGAAGASGEEGESGEAGDIGTDGEEGESGGEGEAGAAGTPGVRGEAGVAGVEGDLGDKGPDGIDGEDGTRDDPSGILAVELNNRPTVDMTNSSFKVTPGSVTMQLNMSDREYLANGRTQVKIYDRATMQQVNTKDKAEEWGQELESGSGSAVITQAGLKPDREYVIIVSGEYQAEKDGEYREADLFTKIVRTDELGITMEKVDLTDSKIELTTKTSPERAEYTYDIELYQYKRKADGSYEYDANGEKIKEVIGAFRNQQGGRQNLVFSLDVQNSANMTKALEGDTTYYAAITNVKGNGAQGETGAIETGDTELELQTLKTKPYSGDGNKVPFTEMKPVLTENKKNNTLTVSLGAVIDEDSGVREYRYELFDNQDIVDGVSEKEPLYVTTSEKLQEQTFKVKEATTYVARIVAVFDDNEKVMEYSTLFSDPLTVSDIVTFPVVRLVDVTKTPAGSGGTGTFGVPDKLTGYVMVTDGKDKLKVDPQYPLYVELQNEHEGEILTCRLTQKTTRPGSDADYYFFEHDGLRKDSLYSIAVYGAVDMESDGIDDTEKRTYLTGSPESTTDTYALRAAFTSIPNSAYPFQIRLSLTEGAKSVEVKDAHSDASETMDIADGFYEYEAGILSEITVKLYKYEGVGESETKKELGTCHIMDPVAEEHDSIFLQEGWVDPTRVTNTAGGPTAAAGALKPLSAPVGDDVVNRLVLIPDRFGRISDELVGGGKFELVVTEGNDYSERHKNQIPFDSDYNSFTFDLAKQHTKKPAPYDQVQVSEIRNGDKIDADTYIDGLDDDTVTGLSMLADYSFGDAQSITYKVYQLNDADTPAGEQQNIYSKNDYTADQISKADPNGVQQGELLCSYTVTGLDAANGNGNAKGIKLYFKDLLMVPFSNGSETGTRDNWTPAGGKTAEQIAAAIRGGRYFITYEAECLKKGEGGVYSYNCEESRYQNGKHIYPYCAYPAGEPVPYYRSKILSIEKQKPKVERYPYRSDDTSATWMYKIDDPDQAIAVSDNAATFNLLESSSYGAAQNSSPRAVSNFSEYKRAVFKELTLNGLSDGKYYAVEIPYKLLNHVADDDAEKVISKPVRHKALMTGDKLTAANGAYALELAGIKKEDGTRESAVSCEGGYQYRLLIRGKDISGLAALRITFTGKDKDDNEAKVVYDPVYPDLQNVQITEDDTSYQYAYAYVDASGLESLMERKPSAGSGEPLMKATVTVEGYYGTNNIGVEGYTADNDALSSDGGILKSNLFALRRTAENGAESYLYLSNNRFQNSPTVGTGGAATMARSLFIPGSDENGTGYWLNAGASVVKDNWLKQRYPSMPLTLVTAPAQKWTLKTVSGVALDETGMRAKENTSESGDGYYYMPEKLALCTIPFKVSGDANIDLREIMPAVDQMESSVSKGIYSFVMDFELKGIVGTERKIYAEIRRNKDGAVKALQVEKKGSTGSYYYEVKNEGGDREKPQFADADYFKHDSYKDKELSINQADGKSVVSLRVTGLQADMDYQVVVFTYDKKGERQDLYSIDQSITGYPYPVKTRKEVQFMLEGPEFYYNAYGDKGGRVGFGLNTIGEEGTGMIAWYQLVDKDGNQIGGTGWKELPRIGSGDYLYYGQSPENNKKIEFLMNPAGESDMDNVKLTGTYKLKVKLMEEKASPDGEGDDGRLGYQELTVVPPGALEEPGLLPQVSSAAAQNGKSNITVSVTCTDNQYALMGDTLTGGGYGNGKYSISIFESAAYGTPGAVPLITEEVRITGTTMPVTYSKTFAGDGIVQNASYIVEVRGALDLNNDGTADEKPLVTTYFVNTANSANAGYISTDFDDASGILTINLFDLENFDSVNSVLLTVFKDGTRVKSETVSVDPADTQKTLTLNLGTGLTAGEYRVQMQYRNNDSALGNQTTGFTVKGGAAAQAISSIRQLFTGKDKAADTETPAGTPAGTADTTKAPAGKGTKTEAPAETDTKTETPAGTDTKTETQAGTDTKTETQAGTGTKTETQAGTGTKTGGGVTAGTDAAKETGKEEQHEEDQ